VVIDAPVVGQLRVAFEMAGDGATRVTSLARRSVDGVDVAVVVVDEKKAHSLEAEFAALQTTHDDLQRSAATAAANLVSERDEARDRAAAMSEDLTRSRERAQQEREEAAADIARLEGEAASARAATQVEKDSRLTLLGEREKARAELDRLRGELDAGSATLMREVNEARAARDAAEAERSRISGELSELATALDQRRAELTSARAEIDRGTSAFERLNASNQESLKGVTAQLQTELEASHAARARLERELEELQSSHDGDRASAEQSRLELRDFEMAATTELHQLVQAHAEALAASQAREDTLRASLSAAEADHGQLVHELEALRALAEAAKERDAGLVAALSQTETNHGQVSAELAELQRAWEHRELELDGLRGELLTAQQTLSATQTTLERREEAFAHAVEQRDGAAQERDGFRDQLEQLTTQLQALQVSLELQQQEASEAQRVATQYETEATTLRAERDEARNVARGLHQRIAGGAGVEALKTELGTVRAALDAERASAVTVTSERDRAHLQVEALGRQLDLERSARAKAVLERDQYRDRFRVLTTRHEGSGEATSPLPGPVSDGAIESPTDVTTLPSDWDKKKGP
jgi:chromosome segregation ATPase